MFYPNFINITNLVFIDHDFSNSKLLYINKLILFVVT
ncbi:hypothetical protein SDC9_97319 [bioreactor metagenome]|uniref:Uncharacterized protein n=1 Tax=bioreactor metagenome TaxID=1076179 RepID=A0A645AC19_9ZZZZ